MLPMVAGCWCHTDPRDPPRSADPRVVSEPCEYVRTERPLALGRTQTAQCS